MKNGPARVPRMHPPKPILTPTGSRSVSLQPPPPPEDRNPNPNAFQYIIVLGFANEVHFRMKRQAKLGKLKQSFIERAGDGQKIETTRFRYDGIVLQDDDTPETLNMPIGEESIVDAYEIRILEDGTEIPEVDAASRFLILTMRDGTRESVMRVKCTCRFRRVRQRYSQRTGHSERSTRFRVKGKIVDDEDTPEALGMKWGQTNLVDVSLVRYGSDGREIEGGQPNGDHIDLTDLCHCLQFNDAQAISNANSVDFRVHYNTQMNILKKMFAMVTGEEQANLLFAYMGINVNDNTTPRELEMDDDDTVSVYKKKVDEDDGAAGDSGDREGQEQAGEQKQQQ